MKYIKLVTKLAAMSGATVFVHWWTQEHPMDNATISFYIVLLMFLVSYSITLSIRSED